MLVLIVLYFLLCSHSLCQVMLGIFHTNLSMHQGNSTLPLRQLLSRLNLLIRALTKFKVNSSMGGINSMVVSQNLKGLKRVMVRVRLQGLVQSQCFLQTLISLQLKNAKCLLLMKVRSQIVLVQLLRVVMGWKHSKGKMTLSLLIPQLITLPLMLRKVKVKRIKVKNVVLSIYQKSSWILKHLRKLFCNSECHKKPQSYWIKEFSLIGMVMSTFHV